MCCAKLYSELVVMRAFDQYSPCKKTRRPAVSGLSLQKGTRSITGGMIRAAIVLVVISVSSRVLAGTYLPSIPKGNITIGLQPVATGLAAGADLYLTKPFSPLTLLTFVEQSLGV